MFKSSQPVNSEDAFLRQADLSVTKFIATTSQMEITALKSNKNQDIMTHCGYLIQNLISKLIMKFKDEQKIAN